MSKESHDAAAARLRQQISTFNKPWFRSCSAVLDTLEIKGGRCLDLCSGNCEYAVILRDRYGMEVVCADYIPLHLEQARQEGFATIQLDLDGDSTTIDQAIAEYHESFDLVVNLAAVEHVFCSDNLMQVAHAVLKPQGQFVINTPNIGFLAYRIYSALNGNRPYGEGHHIRFWDFRFLRTCLFFNGFTVTGDFRRFYSLPEEILLRTFRGRSSLARWVARLFYSCFLFQKVSFCRGWATDELTLLCRKESVRPVSFDYLAIKDVLESNEPDREVEQKMIIGRLREAKERGWLKEHIYLSKLIDAHLV